MSERACERECERVREGVCVCVCVHQILPLLVMLLHADDSLAVLLGLRRLLGLELLVFICHLFL